MESNKSKLNDKLFDASRCGDTENVRDLVSDGVNVNLCNDDDYTALMFASQYDNTEVVELLISNGANVNTINNDGDTPLTIASYRGNTDIVKILIDAGANVNMCNNDGNTALINALLAGNTDNVKILIDAGANVNTINNVGVTPLTISSYRGNTDNVKILIDAGANVNTINNNDGVTSLTMASYYDKVDVAKILIDAGAKDHYYIINKSNILSGFNTETLTNGEMVYTHSMYKKVRVTDKNNVTKTYIITLKLPVNAECNIGYYTNTNTDYITNVKYRASYMYVKRIKCDNELVQSVFNNNRKGVRYTVGKMVYSDEYDTNPYKMCTSGIHFFMDKTSAKRYNVK